MSEILTLIDVFPNPFGNDDGIITRLDTYNPPWSNLDIALALDLYYYGNYSGNKAISPLLERLLNDNNIIEDSEANTVAGILYKIYIKRWTRMWEVYLSEYDPTENYNMVENGEDNREFVHGETITRTDNLTHNKTGNESENPNITDTRTPNLTRNVSENIYGFNSSDPSPANSGSEVQTGTETNQRTGTNTHNYNTSDIDTGTQTNAHTGTDTDNNTHELTRHGNIGVTTTQQMLQSEIELWQWEFFTNVLFPDIDKVLCTQIYSCVH